MKVFISWSGDLSRQFAEVFKEWLPAVLQTIKPYYTPSDIEKGARWNTEIGKELDESDFGVLCLTRDNVESSWLVFEAGALSKKIDKSKVCPVLLGIDKSDIKGPISQFQCTVFSYEDIKKLIITINNQLAENKLSPNVLNTVFDKWWPDLESKVNGIIELHASADKTPIRSDRELLEEILQLSRMLAKEKESPQHNSINVSAVEHMLKYFQKIHDNVRIRQSDEITMNFLSELSKSIKFIASHDSIQKSETLQVELAKLNELKYKCSPLSDDDIPF